ncbi:hypothetical protein QF002_008141 [Paraburkholderia youngii]
MAIAQRPQIPAHQIRFARMHQRAAVQVVHEEVAVLAEIHLLEHRERARAQQRVVARVGAAGFVERRDRGGRELDIVLELDLLTGHVGGLGGRVLPLG